MKIRFYFAQTEAEQTRKEYIVRYNMHEGIVTTIDAEHAPAFDLADPDRRHAANVFQTMMQIMNPSPNPVQFEFCFIVDEACTHEHLTEDGICRGCGTDRRGI